MMMIILFAMIITVFMYVELIEIKNRRLFNNKFKCAIQARRGYWLRPKAVRKMLRRKWLHARISGGSEVMSKS